MSKGIKKNTISVFGKSISSNNFFVLVLCVIIGFVMIYRTLYVNKKLSQNTEVVTAEVIDVYWANHGQQLWGYEIKYKYSYRGSEIIKSTCIQKNEKDKIQIGDCIEIIVSLDNPTVQKWNKSKGTFKCR